MPPASPKCTTDFQIRRNIEGKTEMEVQGISLKRNLLFLKVSGPGSTENAFLPDKNPVPGSIKHV